MAAFWPIGTAQIIRIVSYPIRKKSSPSSHERHKGIIGRGHDLRLHRLPLDIPIKIAIIGKIRKRAGENGKREKAGASLLSFPFPSCLARSLFFSPQPPHDTKRPLRRRERPPPRPPPPEEIWYSFKMATPPKREALDLDWTLYFLWDVSSPLLKLSNNRYSFVKRLI